jgi:DNA uptake protein ComE-like DNA-binding protein
MKEQMEELQKLKGIGEVLSRRLVESSYDTIAKVDELVKSQNLSNAVL